MGFASSSAYYQRLMNKVVTERCYVFCYLDNAIMTTRDFEEHERVLRILLSRLQDHGEFSTPTSVYDTALFCF